MRTTLLIFFLFLNYSSLISQIDCFTSYTESDIARLPSTDIEILDSTVFVSTFFGGFYRIENGQIIEMDKFNSPLADNAIQDLGKYQGDLAVAYGWGSNLDIFLFDIQTTDFVKIIEADDIQYNQETTDFGHCFSYVVKSKNELLFVGTSAGLLIYNGSEFSQIKDINRDGNTDFIFDIDCNSDDYALLGTESGIFKIDYQDLFITELTATPCSNLVLMNDNRIYFTNDEDKLFRYENGGIGIEATGDDFFSFSNVNELEKGSNGKLWIANSQSIFSYQDEAFELISNMNWAKGIDVSETGLIAACGYDQVIVGECGLINSSDSWNMDFIDIYPTITQGTVIINLDNPKYRHKLLNVNIINIEGKPIISNQKISSRYQFDLDYLESGIYFVFLEIDQMIFIKKIIKI